MNADDAHDMLMALRGIHNALNQQVAATNELVKSVDSLRAVVAERLNPEPAEVFRYEPEGRR